MRYLPITAKTPTSSGFGPRPMGPHWGIDYACPVGTPIYAAADGIVIDGRERAKGSVNGFGSWIWIDCQQSEGVDLIYGHVQHSGILVKEGDHVKAGQQIGVSGNEGESTGPHLHFEVWTPPGRQGGQAIDPAPWLRGAADPQKPGTVTKPPAPTGGPMDYGITKTILAGTDGPRSCTNNVGIHTQQGGTGDAIGLALYCQQNGVSYNTAMDDVDTVLMVAARNAPWAASAANDEAYHLCLAGSYVAWSRDRWLSKDASDGLDEDAMLWRAARVAAAACHEFNVPVEWVGDDGRTGWPKKRGICGHKDFGQRGGGHTDPYPNFPTDVFIARVQSVFAPPANLIEAEAKAAAKWIGKRRAPAGVAGETILLRDGKEFARFVEYDNGHIYWRTGTGHATAVPHGGIFEAWAERGWERGELGLPVLRHQVFAWGGNQSFDGGTLFVVTGGDPAGYLVHGQIGNAYARSGWETGPLGLPTSDEIKVPGTDNITQHFTNGDLTWSPTGVITTMRKA